VSIRRNTTYNLVGASLQLIGALATVPIYVNLIGPARYGVLAIAWILLGYFGLFDLGLGRATAFRISSRRDESAAARAETFWAAIAVNLGMGAVGGLILWVAAGYFFAHWFKVPAALRPEIISAVPLLALAVPVATMSGVLSGALQAREKFLSLNVVGLVASLLFQLLPLGVVILWGPNLVQLLLAALGSRLLSLVAMAVLCHYELLQGQKPTLNRSEIPHLLKYGGWVTVTSLVAPLLVISDRFAIGATLGAVSVAIYAIPYQPAKQIQMVPASLLSAMFPRISAGTPEERRGYAQNATLTIVSLISLPILGGIFLADPALRLWVGQSLGSQAAPVGRIFLIAFWFNAIAMVPYTSLQASGRPDLVTKVTLLEIPIYLAVLFLLLKNFGIEGAAIALLFRFVLDFVMLSLVRERHFPALGVLFTNLVLLTIGAVLSSLWTITDWRWWASAAVLGLATTAVAWQSLPPSFKEQALSRLPRRWRPLLAP
jgi:O-antigen/teichoic acid export membrane protein